ncbi:myo-inositol-1-phosphate synthase [Actinorhabdospora filicis]|uniref:Myo-inositol-1-phosphate synthase n=1 Tax=Actinorhabdospora filicis TaxID=1785913 RepID=A0A9W6SUA5_9ACTN|nr:inositol-3-phosphate synthase [Actinorhabdospora filicis]GLZ82074.1 myo-inositol-1-phosphate synthase [Actinorhabdospora filicis]
MKIKLATIGVGNNTSALVQGLALYRATGSAVGIRRPEIAGLGVTDVEIVAAFAMSEAKVGADLSEAVLMPPNNFRLDVALEPSGVTVTRGLSTVDEVDRIAAALGGAEVVLYSAPSGRPEIARAYAEAALRAGAAFVNTTADAVARDPELLRRFTEAGLPLLGDDLTSQFGASAVHATLLRLLEERGVTLTSSYQVNLGGTEDFRNLVEHGESKKKSKMNALGANAGKVAVAPLGYMPHLGSRKILHLNIEAQGWGGAEIAMDLKLKVHDPAGAAGVNIDLVRLAAAAKREGRGGYPGEVADLMKSPPGTAI